VETGLLGMAGFLCGMGEGLFTFGRDAGETFRVVDGRTLSARLFCGRGDVGFNGTGLFGRPLAEGTEGEEVIGGVPFFSCGRGFSPGRGGGCILTFGPTLNDEGGILVASFINFLNVIDRC
jgi:hypothetical protein